MRTRFRCCRETDNLTNTSPDTCPICLEALETEATYSLPCGHVLHTKCALQNAWEGNIACPMCRALPPRVDVDEACDRRSDVLHEAEQREIHRLFIRGLAMVRSKSSKLTKKTKTAVAQYHTLMARHKKELELLQITPQ